MLIDEIRVGIGQAPRPWPPVLDLAVCFKVDNIAAYLARTHPQGALLDIMREIPNVAPLAPVAWYEWSTAAGPFGAAGLSTGVLVVAMIDRQQAETLTAAEPYRDGRALLQRLSPAARWCLHAFVCWRRDTEQALALLPDYAEFELSESGQIVEQRIGSPAGTPAMTEGIADTILTQVSVALMSICFAHCKGVAITDEKQPRQQRRAAERAGRPPLVTYKTIDIAPVTRILHEEGQIEKSGISHALHICRGHFAHYTADAPLFGKYTGTFYRPMHVRGSLKQGAVLKDYRVHPSPGSGG